MFLHAAAHLLLAAPGAPAGPRADERVVVVTAAEGAPGLERARAAVRAALMEDPGRDVTVRLAAGVYALTAPLELGPADAGDGRCTVTWAAEAGARVVLSGGCALEDWRVEEDGTWSHAVPEALRDRAVRQLFVAGERRPRARVPQEGWLRVVAPGEDGRSSFEFAPGDLAAWPDLAGADLLFLHDWSTSRVPIARVDEGARRVHLAQPIGAWHAFFHITGFEAHPRYAVENVAAGWDAPGEWLHDRAAGRVRVRPLEGEAPAAVLPVLERLVTVRGEPGRPVRGLVFRGLTFAHTRAADPARGYAGIQAAFFEGREGGDLGPELESPIPVAVRVTYAGDLAFESCRFERLGASGLWLGEGSRACRVARCTFSDLGANGVMIGEVTEPGPDRSEALTSGVVLEDGLVERCGRLCLGAVGIWIGMAENVAVRDCEVRLLPYTGISLGWIWDPRPSVSRGHRIERNHVHHVMKTLSDGGGIYTIGRHADTFLRGNTIHDVARNQGRAPNNGFFLDEGSSELVVEDNVVRGVEGSPIRFHKAGALVIRNNTLVLAPGVDAFTYNACTAEGKVFEGNVISTREGEEPPD